MAQPFNYTLNLPDPAAAVTGGLQQGVQLASMMERADLLAAQRQQTELENQALRVKAQTLADQRARVEKFFATPSEKRTAADYEQFTASLPKEQAENIRAGFEAKTKEQQRKELLFGGQVFAALRNKDTGTASQMLIQKADAFEAAGDKAQAQAYRNAADMSLIAPDQAELFVGTTLSALPGGKEFIENVGKQQAQRFEAEIQPFKVQEQAGKAREQAGKAEEAEVRGRFAEKTVKSEIGQRNAAASASYASAQNSLANAKKAIAQAKTEDETRDARRALLEANANVARAKWQKTMGNPEDARQGAIHGITIIDKLLDPKRKDDIQQIFGQIGTSAKGEFKMGALRPDWSLSDSQMSILADVEQLGGRTFLDQAQKMRGLGQLTEQEGKKIVAAAGNLTRNQSPDRFTETLKAMRDVLAAGAKRKPGEVPAGSLDIGDSGGGESPAAMQTGPITLPSGFKYTFEGE